VGRRLIKRLVPTVLVVSTVAIASGVTAPAADAQAVGKRCRAVESGGYAASHVFVDYMTCRSARSKLRRWLRRDDLPTESAGWYCYRLGEVVHACSYPGKSNARVSFTFWLRRTAGLNEEAHASGACAGFDYSGTVFDLRAYIASCTRARKVARSWVSNFDCYATTPGVAVNCYVRGFKCVSRRTATSETRRVFCRRGDQVVRFKHGY
jgi:hypothetical protein